MKINYCFYIYLIISIICIIIIGFIIYYYNNDNFIGTNNNITFLNKDEVKEIIYNDEDNYIKNLSIYDLKARKVKTNEEYKEKVINSCLDFTEIQKNKLIYCSEKAKKFFNNNYNWIFALINNNYEEGMSHTRMNIVFLSPNVINNTEDELIKTLIHESVHIYQRYNIDKIKEYLDENNFIISRYKPKNSLIRANPDLDNIIYKDKNNIELVAYYSSENPKSLNDITLKNYLYEHPFEKMAYEIAENYSKLLLLERYKNIE